MNYEEEKRNLTKKLIMFISLTVVFTVIATMAFDDNGFFYNLVFGLIIGLFCYVPGRLKGILNVGWLAAIGITIAYNLLIVFLMDKLGTWMCIFCILIPLADMGYSVYKVISAKKES